MGWFHCDDDGDDDDDYDDGYDDDYDDEECGVGQGGAIGGEEMEKGEEISVLTVTTRTITELLGLTNYTNLGKFNLGNGNLFLTLTFTLCHNAFIFLHATQNFVMLYYVRV